AGNAEQFRAGIVRPPDAREPCSATPQNVRHHGDGFDVVDRRRTAVETDIVRERRLQARLALLAFETFQYRRLLAANVGAGTLVHDDIEGKALDVVLASLIGL